MVTFTKVKPGKLSMDGSISGGAPKPAKPTDIGMDTKDFQKQVMDLHGKKVPIEKAHEAIDKHPDVTDKRTAKSMASAVYTILDAGKKV